ncbi:hypothetical protein IE077_003822 [Cardiosporidium cionae]|uniref:Uncharacterized protein n=1 Tax=Cardiosporidium cionae TaxID=476202 RepID=A0ABQ7J7I6_9APIC|nr:hypothetical protein IE077_003822 [Cardiosporidium cionae]|eukprot:KAF8819899.1 hypothetical protein IE077_003822 [Cardiosporidium cionae]
MADDLNSWCEPSAYRKDSSKRENLPGGSKETFANTDDSDDNFQCIRGKFYSSFLSSLLTFPTDTGNTHGSTLDHGEALREFRTPEKKLPSPWVIVAAFTGTATFAALVGLRSYRKRLMINMIETCPDGNSKVRQKQLFNPSEHTANPTSEKILRFLPFSMRLIKKIESEPSITSSNRILSPLSHLLRQNMKNGDTIITTNASKLAMESQKSDLSKLSRGDDSDDEEERFQLSMQNISATQFFSRWELLKLFLYPAIVVSIILVILWHTFKCMCGIKDINHFRELTKWLLGTGPNPNLEVNEKSTVEKGELR